MGARMEPKLTKDALQSGVGQGFSFELVFFYDFLNFFMENVSDFPKIVGKAKFVDRSGRA